MVSIYMNNDTTKDKHCCADYIKKRLPESLGSYAVEDQQMAHNSVMALVNVLKEDSSAEMSDLSLLYNGFEDDMQNSDFNLKHGYKSVLNKIAENIPPDVISMETEVVNVNWADAKNNHTVVICSHLGESKVFNCKHVIITLPLGVLKKFHDQMFNPQLPKSKIDVIQNLGFGKVCKIILFYKEPFWTRGNGGVKVVWDPSKIQFNKDHWSRSLFAFKEFGTNALIAWVCGDVAEEVERLPKTEIGETITTVLRQFMSNSNIPLPEKVLCSEWSTDPYTLGGYTYLRPGTSMNDMDELAKPIFVAKSNNNGGTSSRVSGSSRECPVLLFAGEATNSESYGSTNGGLMSGVREAKRLLKYMGSQYQCEIF